ncbi:hypothetical protein KC363_g8693 [Hortaea werneckii]|nr:hypothetical protein KC325_g6203 [Hortaea werneckii]KAI6989928.1 hypothetical protein KC359_g6938 [Hortaea werneckii]KAI7083890.1 hypothetical protein KC356_g7195 [Hortaea werneckii]KAI7142880.1 hypothetical protein KC344_g6800 [Hortaea werneckii]KAI7170802.1 hypothetical protein KC360_g6529 [Hortaea werneckii]
MPLEKRAYYQGMQNQFADPYIASPDTPEGRDTLRRAEYRPVPDDSIEADARRFITPMLEMVASRNLTPAEIPGEFFMNVNADEQLRICRNLSILLSHSAAGVYRHTYGNFNKARNVKNNKGAALGTIGLGPITEVLYDFGVGVHDTDRANTTHGPTIGDRRPLILLDKGSHGMLRVASITSFGGSDGNGRGAPPPDGEDEYALLVDELASDPPGLSGKNVVRYSGSAMKPKGSWVRLGRYHELPYSTPIEWNLGRISIDAHGVLADAFKFAADHPFREQGIVRRQKRATELEEAGGDAATREERGKRQEREMSQIREREQMQKSARKVPEVHQGEETKPTPRESIVREGRVGGQDPVTAHAQGK